MTLASEATALAPEKLHTIRYEAPPTPTPVADGITMSVEKNVPDDDEDDGLVYNDDGSITVNGAPSKPKKNKKNDHDINLAEEMDEMELNIIASDLLEAIEADLSSRKDWEETFAKGIDLLGLKIESPTSDVTGGGGNISKAKDPLLLEAVLRYQSNFNAEMLPADGPVKVRDDKVQLPPGGPGNDVTPPPMMGHNGGPPLEGAGAPQVQSPPMGVPSGGPMGGVEPPSPGAAGGAILRGDLAEAFQKDFNHYLTVIDKPYYSDTDRMSFSQALGGCAFKKIYRDPLEQRPISRFVMANHIIVDNGASSLHDAKRITHMIPSMSSITMKRMMLEGVYRDTELSQPVSDPGTVDSKIREIEGRTPRDNRPQDKDYIVYEVYCYLDLKGFEHTKRGVATGLPLPYRVTIEKDSRVVLDVRRDWKKGDKDFKRRRHFVKYSLFPGLGFYDYGYVHILGNTTRVLSAIESLMVDQGMFANFPGGLISKQASRQEKNQLRPGPGGFLPIDTGGLPISSVVMAMPYKDISQGLMALASAIENNARKLGSIAELPIGEGRADVPVGTVVALIEQSTKLLAAVHRRNFSSQHEEFEILRELFAEDPAALTRLAQNPARVWQTAAEFQDLNLVPAADPNTSSHMLRVMKATANLQILQQSPPGLLNAKEILTRAFRVMGEEDIEALFAPLPPPGSQPPPPHVLDAQAKAQQLASKEKTDAADQQVKLRVAAMQSQDTQLTNQTQMQISHEKLQQQAMKDAQEFQAGITPPNSMAPSTSI